MLRYMKFTFASRAALLAALLVPLLTFAQTTVTTGASSIPSLFTTVIGWINTIAVPLVFALAFVVFLFYVYYYFIQNAANAEKRKEGNQFLLWSLIGFFVMFSVWGLVNLFIGTLGFNNASQPGLPTFNANTTSGTGIFGTGTTGSTGTTGFGTSPTTGSSYMPVGSTVSQVNGSCQTGTTPNGIGGCTVSSQNTVTSKSNADGTVPPGGQCTNDNNCEDANGQSYGCSGGVCAVDGDTNTADGTVPPGGQCSTDNNCEDVGDQPYGCFKDVCTADGDATASGGTACTYGTAPQGSYCVACSDGSTAADANDCPTGVDGPSQDSSGGPVDNSGNSGS
jgi:hypothetical protein